MLIASRKSFVFSVLGKEPEKVLKGIELLKLFQKSGV
jgi:hypothetical protein